MLGNDHVRRRGLMKTLNWFDISRHEFDLDMKDLAIPMHFTIQYDFINEFYGYPKEFFNVLRIAFSTESEMRNLWDCYPFMPTPAHEALSLGNEIKVIKHVILRVKDRGEDAAMHGHFRIKYNALIDELTASLAFLTHLCTIDEQTNLPKISQLQDELMLGSGRVQLVQVPHRHDDDHHHHHHEGSSSNTGRHGKWPAQLTERLVLSADSILNISSPRIHQYIRDVVVPALVRQSRWGHSCLGATVVPPHSVIFNATREHENDQFVISEETSLHTCQGGQTIQEGGYLGDPSTRAPSRTGPCGFLVRRYLCG